MAAEMVALRCLRLDCSSLLVYVLHVCVCVCMYVCVYIYIYKHKVYTLNIYIYIYYVYIPWSAPHVDVPWTEDGVELPLPCEYRRTAPALPAPPQKKKTVNTLI